MNKRAIKIDLSTFFDDERKMTYVLIDPSWKSVECLQKRVEFLFDVDTVRFLSDGYFLPPQESIEIIKFCDDLRAFVPKESLEKRQKKKSKKCKTIEKSSEESGTDETKLAKGEQHFLEDSEKKRKYNSLGSNLPANNLSSKAKRSKNCNDFLKISNTSEQIPPVTQDDVEEVVKSKKSKNKKSKVSAVTLDSKEPMLEAKSPENIVTANTLNLEENTLIHRRSDGQSKERRTSTPKAKEISEISEVRGEKTFNDEMKAITARSSSIPSSTFINESKMVEQCVSENCATNSPNPNNPFKKPKHSKAAHIYFKDTGETLNPTEKSCSKSTPKRDKEPKVIIKFRCPLSDVTNDTQPQKPRIFHLKSKSLANNKTKKQIVEIQEEIILPTLISLSNTTKKSSIINGNETKQQQTIETMKDIEETDIMHEESSLNNKSIATDNTTIAKNDDNDVKKTTSKDLDVSDKEDKNLTKTQNESQILQENPNETSIMSVDCVDLSIDIDEDADEEEINKSKTTNAELTKNEQQKHDLTADNADNDSSSDIEEIIDLNETEDNCDTTTNKSNAQSNSSNDIRIAKILPFSIDMTDLPNIGDVIVFKVKYLNKKQQYVNTDNLAGKVEYINRRTKSIKTLILDGIKELRNVPNHMFCNLDDSQDYLKHIQLKLTEMIEPKLFSMS